MYIFVYVCVCFFCVSSFYHGAFYKRKGNFSQAIHSREPLHRQNQQKWKAVARCSEM